MTNESRFDGPDGRTTIIRPVGANRCRVIVRGTAADVLYFYAEKQVGPRVAVV